MSGAGIDIRGTSTPGNWDTYNTRLLGVIVNDCTGSGVYFGEHSSDCQVLGLVSYSNDEDGIQTGGSSIQFVDCHVYGNTRYNLYIPSGSARIKVTTSKFEHAGQHGINVSGSSVVIVGCNVHLNGKTTNNTYANIYLNAGEAVIVGNSICSDTGEGGNVPKYGIQVTSSGSGIVASNLVWDGPVPYGTSEFVDASVWTKWVANYGIIDSDRKFGSAAVSTGGTIAHGLRAAPSAWGVQQIVTGLSNIYVTADATNLTVNFTGGGSQTFKWWAEI
jgi:hypothetical protein